VGNEDKTKEGKFNHETHGAAYGRNQKQIPPQRAQPGLRPEPMLAVAYSKAPTVNWIGNEKGIHLGYNRWIVNTNDSRRMP